MVIHCAKISSMAKKQLRGASQKEKRHIFYFLKNIKTETRYGIIAVVSFALALFFMTSAFDRAGMAGRFFYDIFSYLLGWGYFLLPIAFIILGGSFAAVRKNPEGEIPAGIGKKHIFGSVLFLLSALGLLEIFSPGKAGVLGGVAAWPFLKLFDLYIGTAFLAAILIISLLVIFEKRLALLPILNKVGGWMKSLFARKEKLENDQVSMTNDQTEKENYQEEVGEAEGVRPKSDSDTRSEKKSKKQKEPASALGYGEAKEEFSTTNHKLPTTNSAYIPPPLELLERDSGKPATGDIKANMNIIKRTLQNFGIEVEMDEVTIGPSVTRYALKPAEGVKLSRILSLQNDIALALAAHPIRIEAPIPGRSLVGIEVPNRAKSTVGLATLLSDEHFQKASHPLLVALGKSIAGRGSFGNLAKMPHALIGGATGAGKSVLIHALITSLLYRNSPADLRFIMIDPKRVELTLYNGIPHLLTPAITDPKKAILSLKWAAREMERRYNILEQEHVRDISSYHGKISKSSETSKSSEASGASGASEEMPYIVIIIDELADIMSTYPRELESAVVRLAQMSRAVGIHLILSTQRPSVNVITGLIKANIPARIALQVSSQIDSRTILDSTGAEKLLGAGDMLFLSGEMAQPERLQSAFISENEVKKVVKFITKNNPVEEQALYGAGSMEMELSRGRSSSLDFTRDKSLGTGKTIFDMDLESNNEDDDELYEDARIAVIEAGKASTSYLQRKLKIGYSRAASLIDMLEERGVVGAGDGAKPREVLEKPIDNIASEESK